MKKATIPAIPQAKIISDSYKLEHGTRPRCKPRNTRLLSKHKNINPKIIGLSSEVSSLKGLGGCEAPLNKNFKAKKAKPINEQTKAIPRKINSSFGLINL